MKLWIDLDNSPHVHFFAPIIQRLEKEARPYLVTARSFSQTEDLARHYGFRFETIGVHRQRHSTFSRVAETAGRALALARYIRAKGVTAAVSHGSRAQLLAAQILRIPAMTLYDYEFVFSSFSNRFSKRVMVPAVIPADRLAENGLRLDKLIAYPGFKEEVYIYDFEPDRTILSTLGLDPSRPVITLRPPHSWAHYHSAHSEVLLDGLLQRLAAESGAQVMVLCRTAEQAESLSQKYQFDPGRFRLLTKGIDGLSLMWFSDAIFSGGGTMVREAALLGLNAYSIFAGKLGAADAALEKAGKLHMIRELAEIERISLGKRLSPPAVHRSDVTRDFISDEIVRFAEATAERRTMKREGTPERAIQQQ